MFALIFTSIFLLAQQAADTALEVDVQFLNFAVGTIIPLLVGLLSKLNASSGVKAVINLLLSAIAGAITVAIQANGSIELAEWVTGIGMTWLTSIVSYHGLWKPTQVAKKVQTSTANVGVGKNVIAGSR